VQYLSLRDFDDERRCMTNLPAPFGACFSLRNTWVLAMMASTKAGKEAPVRSR